MIGFRDSASISTGLEEAVEFEVEFDWGAVLAVPLDWVLLAA